VRRVAWSAFVILATLAALVLLWRFSLAIVLFLLSLVVASAIRPAVSRLIARGVPRRRALSIVYGTLVVLIVALSAFVLPRVGGDLQRMADDIFNAYERSKMEWPRGGTQVQRIVAAQLPPAEEFFEEFSTENGMASIFGVLGVAQNMLNAVALAGIVIVLSMYWSADRRRLQHLSLSMLPREHHERVRGVMDAAENGVGAYVRGEIAQSVLAGVALGIIFWLVGLPYPALLALWVAVVRLIPWFGLILAILPSALAVLAGAVVAGITSGLITLAVLFIFILFIAPRYFASRRPNGLWLLIAIVSMGELWGAGGAMIAPVIAITIQAVIENFFMSPGQQAVHALADRLDAIGDRLADLSGDLPVNGEGLSEATQLEIQRLQERIGELSMLARERQSQEGQ
jgi:predicted PurR-regulated permease PerM